MPKEFGKCYDYAQVHPDEYEQLKQYREHFNKLMDGIEARDINYITGLLIEEAEEIVKFYKENI